MVSIEMAENPPSPRQDAPSPQCVGREFVRQYYTLLAEAPRFVHRFYSNESIYVHGSDEEIVGQTAIEKKIAALGFHECRTRIRVLDSHETIGKGVVVQVVGEITVNGDMSAMRRFVQTFVLAPQSEKKYYVYNDIFRYEDELFKEAEGKEKDGENDSGVPDPSSARPVEQQQPRANGGMHSGGEELEKYYSMLPGQTQPQQPVPPFQTPAMNDNQHPPSTRAVTAGYAGQAPLPQRNAAAVVAEATPAAYASGDNNGNWTGNSAQLPQPTSSVAYPPTGPAADAHQQQYAQTSQEQQQPTAAPFNAALPSQSPVPSSTATPQAPAVAPPMPEQPRPQSVDKESPGAPDDQEQQQPPRDATAPTYASLLKKQTKGPQQPSANIPAAGQPHMVSPGQNAPFRPPMEAPMPAGQQMRWSAPPQQNFPPNYQQPAPWDMQQYPRQYRPSYPNDYPGGAQSQDARASPAPSGGGGTRGGGRDIPLEEGVYLKNVPMLANEDQLRNMITETGFSVRDVRLIRKEGVAFAFIHLDSKDSAERLLSMQSIKLDDAQILIQPLRRSGDAPYVQGGRPGPGAGPGPGYSFPPNIRGRGGRGNMAQRGDRGGGRGGRGGGNTGGSSRMFSAGGGHRGGGSYQNN